MGSAGFADHSTTNVQVTGVDEPDFVKNDGKYIYVITGQTLAIVDAYPAAPASVVSKTEIGDFPGIYSLTGTGSFSSPRGRRSGTFHPPAAAPPRF